MFLYLKSYILAPSSSSKSVFQQNLFSFKIMAWISSNILVLVRPCLTSEYFPSPSLSLYFPSTSLYFHRNSISPPSNASLYITPQSLKMFNYLMNFSFFLKHSPLASYSNFSLLNDFICFECYLFIVFFLKFLRAICVC